MKVNGNRILVILMTALLILGSTMWCALAEEKEAVPTAESRAIQSDAQMENAQTTAPSPSISAPEVTVAPTVEGETSQVPDENMSGENMAESTVSTESVNGANIVYSTHVQNIGWQASVSNGNVSGTTGLGYRLEGIKIAVNGSDMGVTYRTHVQDYGWQSYVNNNEVSGTVGQAKRLEAIQIELTGNQASQFDVYYRVHAQDYGWLDWAKNGQMAGTEGLSKRLEAIQIQLVIKGGAAPGTTTRPYVNQDNAFLVKYQTHVENIGWQGYVGDGNTSGTQGESKRLEAIRIKLGSNVDGGIRYRTHIQNVGWESSWAYDGNMSGTQGQSLRLEAIQIELTGNAVNQYDVYYRVHAQNFGWMGWAKNGESAGTEAYGYRLEAIQIQLVNKGGAAPGTTDNAFNKDISRPAKNAYRAIIAGICNEYEYGKYLTYQIFDMDSDGVPELIVNKGTSEANNRVYFYTYKNGQVKYIGNYIERTMVFYGETSSTSGSLISVKGFSDYQTVYRWSIPNDILKYTTIAKNQYVPGAPANYYKTNYPVPYRQCNDPSLL